MHGWIAFTLALLLAACPIAAAGESSGHATQPHAFSAVVLQETDLRDAAGEVLTQLKPYDVLRLLALDGGVLLVLWQDGQGQMHEARLTVGEAAVVLGPPAAHQSRLKRIRQANLPPKIKTRLMAGRIKEGDDMWRVELAWGRPERSFMVNHLSDEQHFVYLTPGGKPVLLRFVAGALKGPLPAHNRAAAAQVESPIHAR
jgi:hypothetical protein